MARSAEVGQQLLNHLNLFGESYGGAVDAMLVRYVG